MKIKTRGGTDHPYFFCYLIVMTDDDTTIYYINLLTYDN